MFKAARRRDLGEPGFFSSARSFSPPVGPRRPRIGACELGGYYIDFGVKASDPSFPPPWLPRREEQLHVAICQWGLGCYERYLAGDGERWLAASIQAADHLIRIQERKGRFEGGWVHLMDMPHTFPLKAPWLSSIAQGQAASLLVRVHKETEDEAYAERARLALRPFSVPVAEGGLRERLGLGPFFEEYPTDPPSYVLNGAIYAIWGPLDVAIALGDAEARDLWAEARETLVANLPRWDTGFWSRYDLYPHPLPNLASSAYHLLHIRQLEVMQANGADPRIERVLGRFRRYFERRANRVAGFAGKALFRIRIPRGRPAAALRRG